MTQVTDTDIKELTASINTLAKTIGDLTLEMRVGFAEIKGEINTVETKLEAKIDQAETKLGAKIDQVEAKLEGKIDTANARLTNLETNTKNIMDLAEKLGELKNWKQIAVSILTAVVGGVIAWFVRGGSNH
jgi:predicted  nucleic acid-binding Zn-ribbon protein